MSDDAFSVDDDRLLSVQEFCQRNSVKLTKFYELIARGLVEAMKIDSKTVVSVRAERAFRAQLPRIAPRPSAQPEARA